MNNIFDTSSDHKLNIGQVSSTDICMILLNMSIDQYALFMYSIFD